MPCLPETSGRLWKFGLPAKAIKDLTRK